MPKVLILSLYDLTILYFEISGRLRDVHFHWLVTKQRYRNWLIEHGISEKDITCLLFPKDLSLSEENRARIMGDIALVESAGDLTLNQAILMDRFLCSELNFDTYDFVLETFRRVRQLLMDFRPDVIFFEPTNITELVTYMNAVQLGIPTLYPADMRYPASRVIFTRGYLQADAIVRSRGETARQTGQDLLDDFANRLPQPFSFSRLNAKRKINMWALIQRVLTNLWRDDDNGEFVSLTRYNRVKRFVEVFLFRARAIYLGRFFKYGDLTRQRNEKFVYYPLHVSPELSIDVLGSFYAEQYKLLRDIRRSLPADATLLVKDHPNFIGNNPISMAREIADLPGTRLLNFDVPSIEILKNSDLIITVSGTAAYEAGMLGIPAITLSPMYFCGFSSIRYCEHIKDLKVIALEMLSRGPGQVRQERDAEFMAQMIDRSWEGYWTDPVFDESVLDDDNVRKLSSAISDAITSAK